MGHWSRSQMDLRNITIFYIAFSNIPDYTIHKAQKLCILGTKLFLPLNTFLALSTWVQTVLMSACSKCQGWIQPQCHEFQLSRITLLSSILRQTSRFERTLIWVFHNIQNLLYSLIISASSKTSKNCTLFVLCFQICTVSKKLQILPSGYLSFPIYKREGKGEILYSKYKRFLKMAKEQFTQSKLL